LDGRDRLARQPPRQLPTLRPPLLAEADMGEATDEHTIK
jgi:hypothetical protein